MREVLIDMVQQLAPLFERVRVTVDDDGSTHLSAYLDDKNLLMTGLLAAKVPEFINEFGIGSLSMLKGLLDFASYKTDDAKLIVHRTKRDDSEYVTEFEFRDGHGGRSRFKTMSAKLAGDKLTVANIPWEMSFNPDKAKTAEIVKLSQLFPDDAFGMVVENGTMFLTIGTRSDSTHSATIMVTDGVDEAKAKMVNNGELSFSLSRFNNILRNAGTNGCTVKFSSRGVIGMVVSTKLGEYTFYIRGKQG